MSAHELAVIEEREARAQQRHLQKMWKARDREVQRDRHARMRRLLRETATPHCRCAMHVGMDYAELAALGNGCTDPHYVCPRLAKVREGMR